MPGRIERAVVTTLTRWYPTLLTVISITCEVYDIDLWRDSATGYQKRERDLQSKYLVVRRALLRLEERGAILRSERTTRWGAEQWILKDVEKVRRQRKREQIGLRVV